MITESLHGISTRHEVLGEGLGRILTCYGKCSAPLTKSQMKLPLVVRCTP